jgi:hypothetical protein
MKTPLLTIFALSAPFAAMRWEPIPGTCNFIGISGDVPNQAVVRMHECTSKAAWAASRGLDTTVADSTRRK